MSLETDLIKILENIKLSAYLDSAGIPTIGYGTTHYPDLSPVKIGDKCTIEQAELWLQIYLDKTITPVITHHIEPLYGKLPDKVKTSLYSFSYNTGSLIHPSILECIKKKNWGFFNELVDPYDATGLARVFLKYVYVKGVFIQGLQNRRVKEIKYFLNQATIDQLK